MEQKLIAAGVRNLHEFGYPQANEQNIMIDEIYSAFFSMMLKDSLGKNGVMADAAIGRLLERLDNKAGEK